MNPSIKIRTCMAPAIFACFCLSAAKANSQALDGVSGQELVHCPGQIYSAKRDGVQVFKKPSIEAAVLETISVGDEVCYLGEDFSREDRAAFAVIVYPRLVSSPDEQPKSTAGRSIVESKKASSDVAYVKLSLLKKDLSPKDGQGGAVTLENISAKDKRPKPPLLSAFEKAKQIVNGWRYGLPPDSVLGPFENIPERNIPDSKPAGNP